MNTIAQNVSTGNQIFAWTALVVFTFSAILLIVGNHLYHQSKRGGRK